jgi:hypothetical protein
LRLSQARRATGINNEEKIKTWKRRNGRERPTYEEGRSEGHSGAASTPQDQSRGGTTNGTSNREGAEVPD